MRASPEQKGAGIRAKVSGKRALQAIYYIRGPIKGVKLSGYLEFQSLGDMVGKISELAFQRNLNRSIPSPNAKVRVKTVKTCRMKSRVHFGSK